MRTRVERGDWRLRVAGFHAKDGWEVAHAALLRDLTGESQAAIARQLGRSPAYPDRLLQVHAGALAADPSYAERYARLVRECLERVHSADTKW